MESYRRAVQLEKIKIKNAKNEAGSLIQEFTKSYKEMKVKIDKLQKRNTVKQLVSEDRVSFTGLTKRQIDECSSNVSNFRGIINQ